MLRNELHRGSKIHPPPSNRIIKDGYYDPIPLKPHREHKILGYESNLMEQLHRGMQIPNPKPRLIDHDRTDRINTQLHGLKVQIGSVSQLNKTTGVTESLSLTDVINKSSDANTKSLALAIGIPVTNNIPDLKRQIDAYFILIAQGRNSPDAKTQKEILDILKLIALQSTPIQPTQPIQSKLPALNISEMKNVESAQLDTRIGNPQRLSTKAIKTLAIKLGINAVLPRKSMVGQIFNTKYVDLYETRKVLHAINNGVLDNSSDEQNVIDVINN
jgi:hypothetical protein